MNKLVINLEQIVNINLGHPFREKIPETPASGILAVQMKNISLTQEVTWQTCIETSLASKRECEFLEAGDILFIARGSNNYAVVINEVPLSHKAIAAPHFYVLSCKNDKVLPKYLAWLLNQVPCQRYFEREAEGTLTKSIRRNVLAQTPIVVPSISEQQSIINLAANFQREQQIIDQIARNNKMLMNAIATDLFKNRNN